MKIRILTFHTPINYGALLQSYATFAFLRKEFSRSEVKILDFRTRRHKSKYRILPPMKRDILAYLKEFLATLRVYMKLRSRKVKFQTFLNEEFTLTERFKSLEELSRSDLECTHMVLGSDQVLHPKGEYRDVYYLDWLKGGIKKIAFASSFGTSDLNNKLTGIMRDRLSKFDFLSCREQDGASFLQANVNSESQWVLDPIFLLSKRSWAKCSINPNYNFEYTFVYDLNGKDELINVAKKIREETGAKIVCQTQNPLADYDVDILLFNLGPREFVGHMLSASHVVTDSFHGTAFAVHFGIDFYTYIARPKAANRILSLTNLVGCDSRVYLDSSEAHLKHTPELDKSLLDEKIEFSKNWLRNSFN